MSAALPIVKAAPPPLPRLQALAALWQEVAARPLWAPPNFFRYLRLRAQVRLQRLDPARVPVRAPAGKINDCSSCTESCCVGPHATVLLGLDDIARLLDLGRPHLMTASRPRFAAAAVAARPALRRQLASRAWQTFPVLRQDAMGACAALRAQDGRCSLHPHWPSSCARFPYALHGDDLDVFYSRRCRSFWVHPAATAAASAMAVQAVAAYNLRIRDWILLAYAPQRLRALGLTAYLAPPHGDGGSTGAAPAAGSGST